MKKNYVLVWLLFIMTVSCAQEKPEFEKPLNILIFSKTSGFRHGSISAGIKMLYDEAPKQNWILTATEEPSILTEDVMKNFEVVVFLNPTGDALNDAQQKIFEKFFTGKKGFVGIHSAADCEYGWPFYAVLIGAYFKTHPPVQQATINFDPGNHPAMKPFAGMKSFTATDEWYAFKTNPRSEVNVLATLDENSIKKYDNANWRMGDHPIIWWNEKNGIRSFYSGFGHTDEAFQDPKIKEHIICAINWAGYRLN